MTTPVDNKSVTNYFAHRAVSNNVSQIELSRFTEAQLEWVAPELTGKIEARPVKFNEILPYASHVCSIKNQIIGCFNEETVTRLLFSGDEKTSEDIRIVIRAFYADLHQCLSSEITVEKISDIDTSINFILTNLSIADNDILATTPFYVAQKSSSDEKLKLNRLPLGDSKAEINFAIEARISATEIFDLTPGKIIHLQHAIAQPFTAKMEGETVGAAYLCQKDEKVQATFIKEK